MTANMRHWSIGIISIVIITFLGASSAYAAEVDPVTLQSSDIVRTGILLSILAILPSIFITMTSFMRIAIVLAMVRHAFGMPETPPNAVLVSLAMFLTLFVMAPTFETVNSQALQPYLAAEMTTAEAIETGSQPLKTFMLAHVPDKDLETMYILSKKQIPESVDDVDLMVLTPAFILNELRIAFTIGFIILLPFLLIDLVVSSILLSLGMMMVPPATISLPIKLLMFVIIDGWALIIEGVLRGFG